MPLTIDDELAAAKARVEELVAKRAEKATKAREEARIKSAQKRLQTTLGTKDIPLRASARQGKGKGAPKTNIPHPIVSASKSDAAKRAAITRIQNEAAAKAYAEAVAAARVPSKADSDEALGSSGNGKRLPPQRDIEAKHKETAEAARKQQQHRIAQELLREASLPMDEDALLTRGQENALRGDYKPLLPKAAGIVKAAEKEKKEADKAKLESVTAMFENANFGLGRGKHEPPPFDTTRPPYVGGKKAKKAQEEASSSFRRLAELWREKIEK